jgi:ceramide glucosyltransferase
MHALQVVHWAVMVGAVAPLGFYLLASAASLRFFGRRASLPEYFPPLSILKPIKGLDRDTYQNYASFCTQDYPEYEILFNAGDDNDPAILVIRRLMQDFPQRQIRLFVGAKHVGTLDKVNKLARMSQEARHDLLVVSDSDIRVGPEYLKAIAAPFIDPQTGVVTCLYRGLTGHALGSQLEALGNSTDFAAGVLAAQALGEINFALGATMATTKQRLAEIGGFEALANHFTDDYELGHRIHGQGWRVELARIVVETVYSEQTLGESFRHQVQWNLAMRHAKKWGHAGLVFTQGLPWAIAAAIAAGTRGWAAVFLGAYVVLRLLMAWIVGVRGMGDELARRKWWLVPLRDAFGFAAWVASFFKRQIEWRGVKYSIRDNRLIPVEHP